MFDRLEHFFRNQDNMITLTAVLSASTVTTTFLQFLSGAYVFAHFYFKSTQKQTFNFFALV